ncbi:MAG: biliverdin-producing heme oxygenase [Sphingomonas bacterium]|nr:biliverdin-producing heme oxygenase [Sphingomonas bacterium]
MSGAMRLRAATAAAHERVDARFGAYDLTDRTAYGRFLIDHARAVGGAEAYLSQTRPHLVWRPRLALIAADLADLGHTMPAPCALDLPPDAAVADGVVYVLEGSRLGGQILARAVGPGLPTAYLGATHLSGEWRALRQAIDARVATDPTWLAGAKLGAEACFALY